MAPNFARSQASCTDKPECWPEGSAMRTGIVLANKQEGTERLLAQEHERLVKLVSSSVAEGIGQDERLLSALKTQEEAWLKYRNEECELIGALTGAGGSWPSTYAVQCESNHTDQRLRRVRSAIACIEKIPAESRSFDQNRCLQQLAPLTNR